MSTHTRRSALTLLGSLLPALALGAPYPDRPIKLIVALAAGGPADTAARVFAPHLADALGQSVFIENRTGAIFNEYALAERVGEMRREHARCGIGRTAGGKRDDELNRPIRIGRAKRQRGEQRTQQGQGASAGVGRHALIRELELGGIDDALPKRQIALDVTCRLCGRLADR